jgi:hypothetical protein
MRSLLLAVVFVLGGVAFVLLRRERPDLVQRLRGGVKQTAGQATGDDGLRAEGNAGTTVGRVRQAVRNAVS